MIRISNSRWMTFSEWSLQATLRTCLVDHRVSDNSLLCRVPLYQTTKPLIRTGSTRFLARRARRVDSARTRDLRVRLRSGWGRTNLVFVYVLLVLQIDDWALLHRLVNSQIESLFHPLKIMWGLRTFPYI